MPNLNLFDEEDDMKPDSYHVTDSSRGGGSTLRLVIILTLVTLIIAGLVYVLNSRGIVRLWNTERQPPRYGQTHPRPGPEGVSRQSSVLYENDSVMVISRWHEEANQFVYIAVSKNDQSIVSISKGK